MTGRSKAVAARTVAGRRRRVVWHTSTGFGQVGAVLGLYLDAVGADGCTVRVHVRDPALLGYHLSLFAPRWLDPAVHVTQLAARLEAVLAAVPAEADRAALAGALVPLGRRIAELTGEYPGEPRPGGTVQLDDGPHPAA